MNMWNPQNLVLTICFCSLLWSKGLHQQKKQACGAGKTSFEMRKCIFYGEAGCKTQRRPQVSGRPFLHRSTARDQRETTRVSAVSSSWHCNKHKRNTVCFSNIQSTPQLWAELQIFKWIPSEMKDYTTGVQQECRSHPSPLHPSPAIPSTWPSSALCEAAVRMFAKTRLWIL